MRTFTFIALLLLSAAVAQAGTFTAATCSRADVNAVINGPTHTAVDGDVIQIPAGSCTWTSVITAPLGVGIAIIGNGGTGPQSGGNTMGASAACAAGTVINSTAAGGLIHLQPTSASSVSRISCLKVTSTAGAGVINTPFAIAGTCSNSTCPGARVDNITIDGSTMQNAVTANDGNTVFLLEDNIFGVADHFTITDGLAPGDVGYAHGMEIITYSNTVFLNVGAYGDNSWAQPTSFGSSQAFYIENGILGRGSVPSETEAFIPNSPDPGGGKSAGGRLVARFINCTGCISGFANHGTDSNGRPRGGRKVELYLSQLNCVNTGGCPALIPIRSGVNMSWGNKPTVAQTGPSTWWSNYISLSIFRIPSAGPVTSSPWNTCDGTGPYDKNSASPVICIDEPGYSGGTLLSGATPSPTTAGGLWSTFAGQSVDANYEWNDTGDFAGRNPIGGSSGNIASNYSGIAEYTHFFSDRSGGSPVAQTSASAPFDGATGAGKPGVGFGLKVRRPTTCTTGVFYFATDEGAWNDGTNSFYTGQGNGYICTATNTWTLSYTPYTYPHPLTGAGGVTAPTCTLSASPSVIKAGTSSTLTFTPANTPTTCSIDNGVGTVSCSGDTPSVSPLVATTYTASVSNAGGSNTCTATVTIGGVKKTANTIHTANTVFQ